MEVLAEIEKIPIPERILLVEAIWDSIAAHPEQVPVSEAQRTLLRERLESYRQNPEAGSSWEEVEARLLAGKRR